MSASILASVRLTTAIILITTIRIVITGITMVTGTTITTLTPTILAIIPMVTDIEAREVGSPVADGLNRLVGRPGSAAHHYRARPGGELEVWRLPSARVKFEHARRVDWLAFGAGAPTHAALALYHRIHG